MNQSRERELDRQATVEIMAETGPITVRMVEEALDVSLPTAQLVIKKLVRQGILERGIDIYQSHNWCHTFVLTGHKPQQVSMFGNASRDWLVAAFFGDYKPEVVV